MASLLYSQYLQVIAATHNVHEDTSISSTKVSDKKVKQNQFQDKSLRIKLGTAFWISNSAYFNISAYFNEVCLLVDCPYPPHSYKIKLHPLWFGQ